MDESVIKHLKQPQVGTLKLSAALRIGASLRGQCFMEWYSPDGRSCALGAIAEASYGHRKVDGNALMETYPALNRTVDMPVDDKGFSERDSLLGVIHRLNDFGWPREQIADWLESQGY